VPLVINILQNAGLNTLASARASLPSPPRSSPTAILKHQMFVEVELVLRRSIVYFTLTILITSAYILTIVISERFISSYSAPRLRDHGTVHTRGSSWSSSP